MARNAGDVWLGLRRHATVGEQLIGMLNGQRIFVVPIFELVVVVTAGLYTSPLQ